MNLKVHNIKKIIVTISNINRHIFAIFGIKISKNLQPSVVATRLRADSYRSGILRYPKSFVGWGRLDKRTF